MPASLSPVDYEDLYDHIVLGGVRSPGVVKISGHDRSVKWDVKTAKGQKGASTELDSIPLTEFTCEFFLADEEDWKAWPAFLALINSTVDGPKPKALDVYHPDLVEQGIHSVVKAKTQGTKHDGKGGQTKVVVFQEYSPPKPKGGSPSHTGSKTNVKDHDPDEAALKELGKLTDEYQSTPWFG